MSYYIIIYIYYVIHRQNVSLYHNSSVRLDTQDDHTMAIKGKFKH